MKTILKEIVKKIPLLFWLGVLSLASWAFAVRMTTRNRGGTAQILRREISTNWGKNIAQKAPSLNASVYYDSPVSSYSEEDKVIAKNVRVIDSKVNVNLIMDYRRKGLVYFPTFVTNFNGVYKVKNDTQKTVRANISFPLPDQNNLVWDVELLADNNSQDSIITSQNLAWSGLMKAGEEKEIVVKYAARGIDDFSYSLAESKGLQNFDLKINVNGADRIDFPSGALSPVTNIEDKEARKWTLGWQFNRVLTSPSITVKMYAKQNISEAIAKLFWVAPFLMFAFISALFGLSLVRKNPLKDFDAIIIVSLYSVFYPLLAYIVSIFENLDLYRALAISAGVISLILLYFYHHLFDLKFTLTYGPALQLIFLIFFPIALLIPYLTGFLFIIGIIFILITIVQLRVSKEK